MIKLLNFRKAHINLRLACSSTLAEHFRQTMHRLRSKHHINPRCALHNASTFLTSYTSAHSNHHVRTIPFSLSNAAQIGENLLLSLFSD